MNGNKRSEIMGLTYLELFEYIGTPSVNKIMIPEIS